MRSAIGKSMLAVVSSCRVSPFTRVVTRMRSSPSNSSAVAIQGPIEPDLSKFLPGVTLNFPWRSQSRTVPSFMQVSPATCAGACEGGMRPQQLRPMPDQRVGGTHEDARALRGLASVAVLLVAVAVVDPHADDLLRRRNRRKEDDLLQTVVRWTARRDLRGDRQGALLEERAQAGELGPQPAAQIHDPGPRQHAVALRAAGCEREQLHALVSPAPSCRRRA